MRDIMKQNKQNLKWGVVASYFWVVVHIGINFIYAPLLIKLLGKNEYGLYQVVASFFAYINVLETSLSAGVLRFYCNAKATKNENNVRNILGVCRKIYTKLTFAIIGIGGIALFAFANFYRSSFSDSEIIEGTIMLGLLIINICITMVNALYLACIRGNERYVFEKLLSAISQIIQPIICFMVLYRFRYAMVVTLIQVIMNAVVSIIRYLYAKRLLNIKVSRHVNDKLLEKQILFFAGSILLSNIADQIFWKTDQIILAKLYDTAMVAVYSIGSQVYTNYMYAGTTVASVFFPKVSVFYHQKNGIRKISDLFIRVGRLAFLACYMVFSGFIIFGKEFIYLWVGEEYYPAYGMALIVMAPFTLDIIQNLGLTILQVINKYSFRAKMYFVGAILNILTTIVLAKHFGGYGAAFSTGITMFITSGIIMNIYYGKVIGLNIIEYWKNILQIFLRLLSVTIIGFAINHIVEFTCSWLFLIAKLITYILIYSIFAYLFVLNEEEKSMIKRLFARFKRR